MSERRRAAYRFLVLAVTGYFSLASIPGATGAIASAHVDVPLAAEASMARIRVTLDANTVAIVAPEALAIQSSSGLVWMPAEPPLDCSRHDRLEAFCELVPGGSHAFDYDLLLASGVPGTTARIEVLAEGHFVGVGGARLGVSIEVLP